MSTELIECLNTTLSPDNSARIAAELKLSELFASPETGLALSQLISSPDVSVDLRQHSAIVVLRKYVKERWSPYFLSFRGSAPPPEIKEQIRRAVFQGLSDPLSRVRSLCAVALSSIANCDWPDEYPDLLTSLIGLISSNSPNSVHGAMQVFTEFIKSDLTEDQILPVLRDLLPVLLSILGATEVQTPLTRSRAVAVFRQCVISLFMVKDQHPQAVKEAVASVLPVWLEAFKTVLSFNPQDDVARTDNWDALAVRIQVFKTLDTIHTSFPRSLLPFLPDLLSLCLSHLHSLYNAFLQYYISSDEHAPQSSESDQISLPQVITAIFDLVAAVVRGGRAKDWLTPDNLQSLVSAVFNFTQMTDDDEDSWANNANIFVAQEDDETLAYSVRIAAFDLLGSLIDRSPAPTTAMFQSTIQTVIVSSQQAREAGNSNWWRPLEAALATIGSQAETIQETIEDEEDSGRPKPIDIEALLANVIPAALMLTEYPFLQGRSFVFASQFAKLLPSNLAAQYLETTAQVIELEQAGIPVKVSAVKALNNFALGCDDDILIPFMPRVAKYLGPFLLVTSEDTLSLVLETLAVVLDVAKGTWLTQELATDLVQAVLEVWSKNSKDPIFMSIFPDIIRSLTSSATTGIYETVVKLALPRLCGALAGASRDESWVSSSSIELIASLVKGAPESGLGDGFFALLAPGLFKTLAEVEDRDTLHNGVGCLTALVKKDSGQVLGWHDGAGQNGLDYILRILAKLLSSQDESGGLNVGELIISLFRKAGQMVLPVLPDLLHAMITRMATAKTATFVQSLVIPFAFLINNQRDTILDLLEPMNINGRSGLDLLIQTWCENAETFQGFWSTRASTLGLCQLFVADRPNLQNLVVKGDVIIKEETKNVIMTRSRTKSVPLEFTAVPFKLKAIKLIIHDIQSGGDSATIPLAPDDEDKDWSDQESDGGKGGEFEFLSDLVGPKGMSFDNDDILDKDDDEDFKDDPISLMNMQEYLVTFFKECATRNTNDFTNLAQQLSTEEMMVLQTIVAQQ